MKKIKVTKSGEQDQGEWQHSKHTVTHASAKQILQFIQARPRNKTVNRSNVRLRITQEVVTNISL